MIGRLRHRVTLQEPVLAPDGSGGFTQTWQDLAAEPQVFAAVMAVGAGEGLRFQQKMSPATHRFILRHRADVTATMRILYAGVAYDIVSALDRDGRGEFLDVLAVRGA